MGDLFVDLGDALHDQLGLLGAGRAKAPAGRGGKVGIAYAINLALIG